MKAAVLGAGAWGTALAKVLAERGAPVAEHVSLWARNRELCDAVNATGENARYLPGVELPRNIECTDDVRKALDGASTVVFVAPSHATREVAAAAAPYVHADALVIAATKGIETGSLLFVDEVLAGELPGGARRLAVLSGPSFARELADRMPTSVVVAAHDAAVCADAMRRLHTPYLRTYASDDVIGVECGGALKNVIAIAAGAVSGMGFGLNTRAAIVTRGLAEIAKLAVARGGSALTLAGLAGMGDLVLTCTGDLSRNRTVGHELGRGRDLRDVLHTLGHVAEGVTTAKSAYELAKKLQVDMPITNEVYAVLYEGKSIRRAVKDLTCRELGYEFDPREMARPPRTPS
ncbi:MAG: NAD(P)-dependent glycerol-3-phosphate dehydrogenase [Polyangiaceae bacterium]|nr:NAD(P)-dependent glycerol-3-phosphate dehydrogenase [Polyangiaceae bacterium]